MGNGANYVLMNLVTFELIQYTGDDLDFLKSRCSEIGRLAKKAASVAVQVINSAWTICSPKQS